MKQSTPSIIAIMVAIVILCCFATGSRADLPVPAGTEAEPAVADSNSQNAALLEAAKAEEALKSSMENIVDAPTADDDVSAQQAPLPLLDFERLYAIPLQPLSKAPKPPTAFTPFNQAKRWSFQRGTGYLFFVKYSNSTVGAYQETFYLPGRFRPNGCNAFSNTSALSTQRMWANSQAAVQATRSRGFPTELATFTWTNITRAGGPAAESIIVRVGKAVALNVTFTISSTSMPPWLLTPAAQADLNNPQLLWPLNATSPATAAPLLVRSPITAVPRITSASATMNKVDSRLLTGVAGLTVTKTPDVALVFSNGVASVVPATALTC